MPNNGTWIPPIRGLIHVTGEPDTGKTTFAMSVPGVRPGEITFFDDDVKSKGIAKTLKEAGTPFGYFADLQALTREKKVVKPLDFYNMVRGQLDAAKKANPNPKVFIYDNASPRLEDAIRAYSLTRITELTSLTESQAKSASMLTWGATYQIYNNLLDELLEYAPMVFFITHIKEKYLGMAKTGQLESMAWSDEAEAIVPVNILPRRVKPLTWKRIVDYKLEPIGTRPPTQDETPNDFELSILDGQLTKDQKDSLRAARIAMENEANSANIEFQIIDEELKSAVKEFAKTMPPPLILDQLRETYPDLNIPKIISSK
jgi:hypothetical protein